MDSILQKTIQNRAMGVVSKFMCLLLFSVFGNSEINDVYFQQKWKTLSKKNYRIEYPPDWSIEDSGVGDTEFILFAPADHSDDNFREHLKLIITPFNFDIGYEQVKQATFSNLMKKKPNALVKEKEIIGKGSSQYYKMTYLEKLGSQNLLYVQYCKIKNKQAYMFTFVCEESVSKRYGPIGDEMFSRFMIN